VKTGGRCSVLFEQKRTEPEGPVPKIDAVLVMILVTWQVSPEFLSRGTL
jgi:hypothetical protein